MKRELKQIERLRADLEQSIAEPIPMKRELKRMPALAIYALQSKIAEPIPMKRELKLCWLGSEPRQVAAIAEPIPMKRELKHCCGRMVLGADKALQSLSR